MLVDLSTWIDIPPLQLSLSTFPNPVVLSRGEEKNIAIQLESNNGFISPDAVHFLPINNYSKIDVHVNNTRNEQGNANRSRLGSGPTNFKIRIANEATTGEYTIPILANISTGSLFPSGFIWLNGYTFAVPTKGNVLRVANLTISVTDPLTFEDQVRGFWSAYGGIISLVGAGFGGALASQVIEWARNRKNNNTNNNNT
jgi:hypothetical protein